MLTIEDCIAFSELTEEEIMAIAEHEHLQEMVAIELGNYLLQCPDGATRIKRMIVEDMDAAQARGDMKHALALKLVMKRFCESHAVPVG